MVRCVMVLCYVLCDVALCVRTYCDVVPCGVLTATCAMGNLHPNAHPSLSCMFHLR